MLANLVHLADLQLTAPMCPIVGIVIITTGRSEGNLH